MKNKLPIDFLLRVVMLLLLLGLVLPWGATSAYSGTVAPEQKTDLVKVEAISSDLQEMKANIKEFEARARENNALELDGQRKKVDWWLNFLAVIMAVLAVLVPVAGVAIPYFMVRKDKAIIEQDKNIIEKDKAQIKQWLVEIDGMKMDAANDVEKIHQHEADAAKLKEMLQAYRSDTASTAQDNDQIKQTIAAVKKTTAPEDVALGLRAEAIVSSQAKDANRAYKLWDALIELSKNDASTQFNAGYWAQELGSRAQGDEKLRWLKKAGQHYAQSLSIKPDIHEVANNWGNVLATEAEAVFAQDPVAARALWQQAGEKYQQALAIKPDVYETVRNWGTALATEAEAVFAQDPVAARALWQQAGGKYQQALAIKPDVYETVRNWGTALLKEAEAISSSDPEYARQLLDQAERLLLAHVDAAPGEVAYNLACVYGLRGDAQSCLKWLRVSQEHKTLPDCAHLRSDTDLNAVRKAHEFVEWFKQVCP